MVALCQLFTMVGHTIDGGMATLTWSCAMVGHTVEEEWWPRVSDV